MPLAIAPNYKFLLILLIVPVQYLITFFHTSDSVKSSNLQDVKLIISKVKNCFILGAWKNWIKNFYNRFLRRYNEWPKEQIDDEILKNNEHKEYFATSNTPRSPRPGHVKFKVGQVVRHRLHAFKGVIIGWDAKAKAPEMWIKYMYQNKLELLQHPCYMILVDYRDSSDALRMYVNQENLDVVTGVKVLNNDIIDYFEYYDGSKYVPRPRLQKLYPED